MVNAVIVVDRGAGETIGRRQTSPARDAELTAGVMAMR